jgi:hypothetical protein
MKQEVRRKKPHKVKKLPWKRWAGQMMSDQTSLQTLAVPEGSTFT